MEGQHLRRNGSCYVAHFGGNGCIFITAHFLTNEFEISSTFSQINNLSTGFLYRFNSENLMIVDSFDRVRNIVKFSDYYNDIPSLYTEVRKGFVEDSSSIKLCDKSVKLLGELYEDKVRRELAVIAAISKKYCF